MTIITKIEKNRINIKKEKETGKRMYQLQKRDFHLQEYSVVCC